MMPHTGPVIYVLSTCTEIHNNYYYRYVQSPITFTFTDMEKALLITNLLPDITETDMGTQGYICMERVGLSFTISMYV